MDMSRTPSLDLVSLPRRQPAPEARRLRELGFDEGVSVEVLHRASLGSGPIACRIGRMTVALRRAVAGAVHVALPAGAE
jgi:ferrous iron transport protein A